MLQANNNSMFLLPITKAEIINTVASLFSELSSGFDEILMKIIKHVNNTISAPLAKILNKSYPQVIFWPC